MLFRIQQSRKERTGCAVLAGVELAAAAGVRATTGSVHGRRGWWVLRAPRSALSAVTCSVWTEANQNDDGDKSGAGEVSVSTETRATMS